MVLSHKLIYDLVRLQGPHRPFSWWIHHDWGLIALIPERELHLIKNQQPVLVTAAYDDAEPVSAFIERIAPVVDANTGTVKVFIELSPDQQTLRPGQFVTRPLKLIATRTRWSCPKMPLSTRMESL